MDPKGRVKKILIRLKKAHPDAKCALYFKTPHELLVATILSAQCTDERVNKVTPPLFKKYPSVRAFAGANLKTLEQDIRSTGFYKNKAKSIQSSAADIQHIHGGKVPAKLEELVKLHGVGRKTANVILGNAFGVPGITVDTHVKRLSNRLGLTKQSDPVKIEFDLMKLIPRKRWTEFSHQLIFHGRRICLARKPDCAHCPLESLCPKVGVTSPLERAEHLQSGSLKRRSV